MFGDILQKFAATSPTTLIVPGLLEQLLNPEAIDPGFEVPAQAQYARHSVLLAGRADATERVSRPGERARRLPPWRDCRQCSARRCEAGKSLQPREPD